MYIIIDPVPDHEFTIESREDKLVTQGISAGAIYIYPDK